MMRVLSSVTSIFVVALLAVVVLPAPAAEAQIGSGPFEKIQPGVRITTSAGSCTLNFIFDGANGKVYAGTAAHCVSDVGEKIDIWGFPDFGTVVYDDDARTDFALLEIDTKYHADVDPAVKGHSGFPTGHTLRTQTSLGDHVRFSGYGMVYDRTTTTQEERIGALFSDDSDSYRLYGPTIFGDSGGPVMHDKTGKALGIVSAISLITGMTVGPTVEGILARLSGAGYDVTLRTV
ncbi:MAG: S1 family peptidase [Euryarchaeota archaeon]|nr:S1 family peptidase [Euryarchaeota archaeon]